MLSEINCPDLWWSSFTAQIAKIAVDNGVDALTDDGFDWSVRYMLEASILN